MRPVEKPPKGELPKSDSAPVSACVTREAVCETTDKGGGGSGTGMCPRGIVGATAVAAASLIAAVGFSESVERRKDLLGPTEFVLAAEPVDCPAIGVSGRSDCAAMTDGCARAGKLAGGGEDPFCAAAGAGSAFCAVAIVFPAKPSCDAEKEAGCVSSEDWSGTSLSASADGADRAASTPLAAGGLPGAVRPAPAEASTDSQVARGVPSPGCAKGLVPLRAKADEALVAAAAGAPVSTSIAGVADMSENDADAVPNGVPAG